MPIYKGNTLLTLGGTTVAANPGGDSLSSLNTITIGNTDYEVSGSVAKTSYNTTTIPFTGSRPNVVSGGSNEIARIYLNEDFDGGGDFLYTFNNTVCGSFAPDCTSAIPSGLVDKNITILRIYGSQFSNIGSNIDISISGTSIPDSSSTTRTQYWEGFMDALNGKTYNVGSTSYTATANKDTGEIFLPGLTHTGSDFYIGLRTSSSGSSNQGFASNGTFGNQETSSIVFDPDTGNVVYTETVTLSATQNEDAESFLDRLGDEIADLDSSITYDGAVRDGSFVIGDTTYTGKYINIDLGTMTAISHSVVLSENSGSNVNGLVEDIDAVSGSGTTTTFTVVDYAGSEVTSFTESVTDSSSDVLDTIMGTIVTAINNNTETPIDFTATWDSTEGDLVIRAAEVGNITGDWSVTVNNNGVTGDAAGDIAAGTLSETNTNVYHIDPTDLPTSDPEVDGVLYITSDGTLKIST